MYHDDDVDFTGSLQISEALETFIWLLISGTNAVFVKGFIWCQFLIKWEQQQSVSVGLDEARFYYSP